MMSLAIVSNKKRGLQPLKKNNGCRPLFLLLTMHAAMIPATKRLVLKVGGISYLMSDNHEASSALH